MKTLNVILSRTVLIGLLSLSIACVDKKKENENESENLHDEEMHDDDMNHNQNMHDEDMHQDGEMGHDEDHHDRTAASKMKVDASQTASSLIDNYLAVKNALVNDDQDAAAKAAESLETSLAGFDVDTVEHSKQEEAKAILDKMKVHAEQMSKLDITHQRTHFAEINADIKNLLAITGSDRVLYEQYCPMYNDNTGGAWLSTSEDIKNPLFGSQMLNCGAVKQTIALK